MKIRIVAATSKNKISLVDLVTQLRTLAKSAQGFDKELGKFAAKKLPAQLYAIADDIDYMLSQNSRTDQAKGRGVPSDDEITNAIDRAVSEIEARLPGAEVLYQQNGQAGNYDNEFIVDGQAYHWEDEDFADMSEDEIFNVIVNNIV